MATATAPPQSPAARVRNVVVAATAVLAPSAVVSAIVVAWFVLFFSPQAAGEYSTSLFTNAALRFSALFATAFPTTAAAATLAHLVTIPFHRAGAPRGLAILAASTITGVAAFAVSFAWAESIQAAGMLPLLDLLIGAYTLAASLTASLLAAPARRHPLVSAVIATTAAIIAVAGALL